MKTLVAAATLLLMIQPAAALEGRAICPSYPAAPEVASGIEAVLPATLSGSTEEMPDWFYGQLACSLLTSGFDSDQIRAMSADELIDYAVSYLVQDRSRADALLAILQAMKQAKLVPATPEIAK